MADSEGGLGPQDRSFRPAAKGTPVFFRRWVRPFATLLVRASLPRDSCRLTGSLCETKLRQHPELVYDSPVLDGLAILEPRDVDL